MIDLYETNNAPRQTLAPPRLIVSAPGSLVLDGFQVSFKASFFGFGLKKPPLTRDLSTPRPGPAKTRRQRGC